MPQRERDEMAGLPRVASLCATAIHGAPIRLGTQLYAVVCRCALGAVGEYQLIGIAEILWDSIRAQPQRLST